MPGHEVVGRVVAAGALASRFPIGEPGRRALARRQLRPLRLLRRRPGEPVRHPVFTGYDRNGGFAEYAVADARFCFALPECYDDIHAAPLLCAGLIGYRAYRLSGVSGGMRLGLYGFGAAAHIICQIAVAPGAAGLCVRATGRRGKASALRVQLGAAGPAVPTSAARRGARRRADFRARGRAGARRAARHAQGRGGGVRRHPHERHPVVSLRAAVGRAQHQVGGQPDARRWRGLLCTIARHPVSTHVQPFALAQANEAIAALRAGAIDGAAVLVP